MKESGWIEVKYHMNNVMVRRYPMLDIYKKEDHNTERRYYIK